MGASSRWLPCCRTDYWGLGARRHDRGRCTRIHDHAPPILLLSGMPSEAAVRLVPRS